MSYANNARIELTGASKDLERRLEPITAEMNAKPLRVNRETWQKNLIKAETEMMTLVEICRFKTHDSEFRPNSPADCEKALMQEEIDKGKVSPKNLSKDSKRISMNADVLSQMSNEGSELADAILNARSAISRHSQLKAWKVYADAGAVQPIWNSMGTPHGRYTSDDPCINNRIVPIRETIEPDPGYSFLSLDFGQAEYVSWASLSKDPALSAAFMGQRDFHIEMANAVRELVPEWDLRGIELRKAGKTLNFAILYQMTEWTLAKKLGCTTEVAGRIIAAYYNRATGARDYIQKVLLDAREREFVETYFGRRRYCPEYKYATDRHSKHELEKTLWHHHNAGTAAELLKLKQVEGWEAIRDFGITVNGCRLSLNMYDECIWQVRDDLIEVVRSILEPIWGRRVYNFLPFPVTVLVGKNWKEISK